MSEVIFKIVLGLAAVHALCGAYFVMRRVGKMDSAADHGTWGFRLLILPGMIVLWPLFLFSDRVKRSAFSESTSLSLRKSHRIAVIALAVVAVLVFVAALISREPGFGELPVIDNPLP